MQDGGILVGRRSNSGPDGGAVDLIYPTYVPNEFTYYNVNIRHVEGTPDIEFSKMSLGRAMKNLGFP